MSSQNYVAVVKVVGVGGGWVGARVLVGGGAVGTAVLVATG